MISFSLLNFGLVCSFSNYLRYKFRLFIKDLSFFSVDVYHYKFLSYYCFHSILGMLCFHLFVSMYFLSYLLSSTLTQYLFKSLLFSFHIFVNFLVFLVLLISFFKKIFYFFIVREGEGEREGETSMCGCLSCTSYWRPGPQPWHVP